MATRPPARDVSRDVAGRSTAGVGRPGRSAPHQGRARSSLRNRPRGPDPAELENGRCARSAATLRTAAALAQLDLPVRVAATCGPRPRLPRVAILVARRRAALLAGREASVLAADQGVASCPRAPGGPVRRPVTRDASTSWSPPVRQPSQEPRSSPEPRRSRSPRPPPRHPRSADHGRVEVLPAVPPAAPPWHAPCLSASSRGRASRTRVVGSPSMYSLPWLDRRRSIVPPKQLARADVPRGSWPRSPSSRTPPLRTMITAASPIQAAGGPDVGAKCDDLSTDRSTPGAVRGTYHSRSRDRHGPTIRARAWDHERRRHRCQRVQSSV
jgi:hypothetical protein